MLIMPEEIAIMIFLSIAVSAGAITLSYIARMYFKYLNNKAGVKTGNSSSSMTTSELESMLRRVVKEANAPVLDRIEDIEERLDMGIGTHSLEEEEEEIKSLSAHQVDPILDELDVPEDLAALSKRKSRTV